MIPILPEQMLEFIQAPVPYILGVPCLNDELASHIGPDVVVFNIDECRFVSQMAALPPPQDVRNSAASAWNELEASGGFTNKKVNYTEPETKVEKR